MKTVKIIIVLVSLIISTSCHKDNDEEIKNVNVDQYIELLKSGNYDSIDLPAFTYQDIPALLTYRNETQKIANFPRNGISSYYQKDCTLGMYVLWTIESIRAVATNSKYLIGRFPSQNPIILKKEEWSIFEYKFEIHEVASQAYFDWWNKNKYKQFDSFKNIDPLLNTDYVWH